MMNTSGCANLNRLTARLGFAALTEIVVFVSLRCVEAFSVRIFVIPVFFPITAAGIHETKTDTADAGDNRDLYSEVQTLEHAHGRELRRGEERKRARFDEGILK
jgi:hypothetical protein